MRIINREERRNNRPQLTEREKIEKRLRTWVKSWTLEQRRLFDQMVKNDVKTQMDKIEETFEKIMNECYGTAIANNIEGLTVDEINIILIEANEYMEDYQKIINENKGDYEIMLKTIEPQVKKRIKEMIKDGIEKLKGVEELRKEYKVPQNELVKMWLDIKASMNITNPHTPKKTSSKKEVAADKEEKKVAKELNKNMEKKFPKEEKKIEVVNAKIKNVDSTKLEEPTITIEEASKLEAEKAVFVNPNNPKLEIVNTIQEIKGQYATYIRSCTGVRIGEKHYNDKSIVEKQRKATEDVINTERKELNDKLKEIETFLKNLDEREKIELEKCAELEAVFDYGGKQC